MAKLKEIASCEQLKKELENANVKFIENDELDDFNSKEVIEITEKIEPAAGIIKKLYACINNTDCKTIEVLLNTPGGDLLEAFAIYDLLQIAKERGKEVITVGMGSIMSAGVIVMVGGSKRYVGKNSVIMLHGIEWQAKIPNDNVMNAFEGQYKVYQKAYIDIMTKHTKLTDKEVKKYLSNGLDNYLTGDVAIQKGLVDGYYC